jgi:hypothetical protein
VAFGNTSVKHKSFIANNAMVEVIKRGNKMLVISIDEIHMRNLEIK